MKKHIGQLISIEFQDLKTIFTGFLIDYSEDWILLRNNPVDFILDGYVLLRNKHVKSVHRDEELEFAEKIIRLKGEKTTTENIIPIKDLASIMSYLDQKHGVFQLSKKSAKSVYLGKLIELNKKELLIDFINTRGAFGGELCFNLEKIRIIEFDTDYIKSLQLVIQEEEK